MEFDDSKHLLNFEEMDRLHVEFIEIYNSVDKNSFESYINVVSKLKEQSIRHFCSEEELMQKYNYPRKREHTDEHKKVLAEMDYFLSKSATPLGKNFLKSYFNEKLPYWFDTHLLSMDSDLSAFIKAKIS